MHNPVLGKTLLILGTLAVLAGAVSSLFLLPPVGLGLLMATGLVMMLSGLMMMKPYSSETPPPKKIQHKIEEDTLSTQSGYLVETENDTHDTSSSEEEENEIYKLPEWELLNVYGQPRSTPPYFIQAMLDDDSPICLLGHD